jgi:hypothetical protein
LALSKGVSKSRWADQSSLRKRRMEGREKRPSERHEKENCDGVEAFLEEPRGEQQPRVELCEFVKYSINYF